MIVTEGVDTGRSRPVAATRMKEPNYVAKPSPCSGSLTFFGHEIGRRNAISLWVSNAV